MDFYRPKNSPKGSGREKPDPKPISINSGLVKPPTLDETIKRTLQQHYDRVRLASAGVEETPDEAEDFSIDDELELMTKYESDAQAMPIAEVRSRLRKHLDANPSMYERMSLLFGHLFKGGLAKPEFKPQPSEGDLRRAEAEALLKAAKTLAAEQAAKKTSQD